MAEELSEYLANNGVRCNYIHSDIDTFERVEILNQLRTGQIDVLVGVNLLREGLDLPEVSLVAIIDADKEGFLRSYRALTQTIGRAARNINGTAILYADTITKSMQQTIDDTNSRRAKQMRYNEEHGITPMQIRKNTDTTIKKHITNYSAQLNDVYFPATAAEADPVVNKLDDIQIEKMIERARNQMLEASKKLDFVAAAQYRDEMLKLQNVIDSRSNK
jgi:excinuclease ABC subunit B